MSKKSWFKGLKKKVSDPRKMDEIQKEYGQLCNQAGQLEYQIYVLTQDLEKINESLVKVNHEAAARQKLDKEAPAPAPAPEKKEA